MHGRLSNRRMASFQGRSANYRTGPNHRAAHFTGDAKSQKRALHELPVFTHFSSLFHFSSFGFENFLGLKLFFVNHFFSKDSKSETHNRQANKLMAPYRENYVHQILIFFVCNSFESTIKRPSRAGSTLQCDWRGPVAISRRS